MDFENFVANPPAGMESIAYALREAVGQVDQLVDEYKKHTAMAEQIKVQISHAVGGVGVLKALAQEKVDATPSDTGEGDDKPDHIALKNEEYIRDTFPSKPEFALAEKPVFVEIGSERGHGSTEAHCMLCNRLGYSFITVDVDPGVCANSKKIIKLINEEFEGHNESGEDFLSEYKSEINVLYLDAFDLGHMRGRPVGDYVSDTIDTYTRRGVSLSTPNSHLAHLTMVENAIDKMAEGGIIIFDDVYVEEYDLPAGPFKGKGETAIPYLLDKGYEIIDYYKQQIILQKPRP